MVRLTCMGSVNRRAGIDLKSLDRREWRVARSAMRTRLGLPQQHITGTAVLAATMLLSIGMAGRLELAALAGGFALCHRCLSDYSRRSWQRALTIEGG